MKLGMLSALCAGFLFAANAEALAPSFRDTHDVRPSALVPRWSGAEPGEWTFDYDAALAAARAEGRYSLLMFVGMWWCPHCQALESRALSKDAFRKYAEESGFYLAAVDFPYRDGVSDWCWLWDAGYRAANGLGDWTPRQISDELVRRFEFQDAWTKGGAVTTNLNVLVEVDGGVTNLVPRTDLPETVYRRVGYPTIVVVKPDGTEAGRLSFNQTIPESEAVDYVVGGIRAIVKEANGSDLFEDPGQGGLPGDAAVSYAGWLKDAETGAVAGSLTVKTGKRNKKSGLVKVSATFLPTGAKKTSLSATAAATNVATTVVLEKAGRGRAEIMLGTEGLVGTYVDASGRTFALQGGRNVFAAKDAVAKARAATVRTGFWTLAVTNAVATGTGAAYARGTGGLTVAVKAKGKAKVSGVLGDGVKFSASAQGVAGEDGVFVVPVAAAPYRKKGELAFALVFQDGLLREVAEMSDWVAAGAHPFTAKVGVMRQESAGAGKLPDEDLLFTAKDLALPTAPGAPEYLSVTFTPGKNKWKGAGETDETLSPAAFSLSYTTKTGLFKGTLTVQAKDAAGKVKKVKAKVFGAVVKGVGRGTAVVDGVGSCRVGVTSACGGDDGC